MNRRFLPVLGTFLTIVLTGSAASVQAGSTNAASTATVRPVAAPIVTRPAATLQQAPRITGAASNNSTGARIIVPSPNAVPAFSSTFQTGGQTTPMVSGTTVGTTPQQPGRLNFAPTPSLGSPGTSTGTHASSSPSAGYTFSTNTSGMVQVFQNGQLISTGTAQNATQQYGYRVPAVTATPTSGGPLTLSPAASSNSTVNSQVTPAQGSAAASGRITFAPIATQPLTPTPSMAVAGPTTPMTQTNQQPARINATPNSALARSYPAETKVATTNASVISRTAQPIAAVGTQTGAPLGSLTLSVPGRPSITLVSLSNGSNQGTANGPSQYQCVALVRSYASQLGLQSAASGDLGNGSNTAQRLASISPNQFTYFSGSSATQAPSLGSVISIAGYPKDPYGHVGIAQSVTQTAPNQYKVTLFDQNWPYQNGQQWKTVVFSQAGGTWVGKMSDTAAPGGQATVSGWANPTF